MSSPETPTIREIAARLGYSTGAVSMALRNHPAIPEATRLKIQQAAAGMGYRVDAHFSQLMAYMRTRRRVHTTCNLAWLYCGNESRAFHREPWAVGQLAGAQERAGKLGLAIDEIWMTPYTRNRESVTRILLARGVVGVIIAPPWHAEAHELVDWSLFATVMISESCNPPHVNQVSTHHFADMCTAFTEARKLGYQRPAYCRTGFFDLVSVGGYTGAFLYMQQSLPPEQRVPLQPIAKGDEDVFSAWFNAHRPDVLITSESETLRRVQGLGLRVPDDVGLIHLSLGSDVMSWTGIDQQHELLGSAAVDIVSNHLNRNERGIPKHKRQLLLNGLWHAGSTTRAANQTSAPRVHL